MISISLTVARQNQLLCFRPFDNNYMFTQKYVMNNYKKHILKDDDNIAIFSFQTQACNYNAGPLSGLHYNSVMNVRDRSKLDTKRKWSAN